MKKRLFTFIKVSIAILIILALSWVYHHIPDTVKYGTYYMEADTDQAVSPRVIINDKQMIFMFDFLSSHLTIGKYSIEGDILTMTTDDGKEKYVFQLDGDTLIFLKSESSPIKFINEQLGMKIEDKAKFHLKDN